MGQQFITSEQGQQQRCLGLTVRLNHQCNLVSHSLPSYTANPILQLPHTPPLQSCISHTWSCAKLRPRLQHHPNPTRVCRILWGSTLETCHILSVPSYLWPISSLLLHRRLLGTAIFASSLCPSMQGPQRASPERVFRKQWRGWQIRQHSSQRKWIPHLEQKDG